MREAHQGFFDIAVNFKNIFCSAKVDCAHPATGGDPARPIDLVIDPTTGLRVPSIVWAFACTDGNPSGAPAQTTHLYVDDLVLRCGATTYPINPSAGPGNLYPGGTGAPAPLVQAMVFEGCEQLQNAGAAADKVYWNVALGLNPGFFVGGAPTCTLETTATASSGPLAGGHLPPDTTYPVIAVSVPINSGATVTCTQHPLDGGAPHDGVATSYGSSGSPHTFGHVALPSSSGVVTAPLGPEVDECVLGTALCGAHASCVDLQVGYLCSCAPGFEEAAGGGCADLDECLLGTDICAGATPFCFNTTGSYTCHAGDDVVALAAGNYHGLALRADGTLAAWGSWWGGENTVPPGLTDVIAIAAGGSTNIALKIDGTVVVWGTNSSGQATAPPGLSGVKAIAMGANFTLAVKQDGSVVGWGSDSHGQTTQISSLSGIVAVAGGGYHMLALSEDGTVTGRGYNGNGEITPPPGLSGVVAIAAGHYHSLALKQDGTVVGWGYNDVGQATVPAGLTGVVAIAAVGHYSAAVKGDGTVVVWGAAPSLPPGLSDVVALAAGADFMVALKADGAVVAWGGNGLGQTTLPPGL